MKKILLMVGILLILNGLANIIDDAMVRTYDLTSVFAGIGFVIISRQKS